MGAPEPGSTVGKEAAVKNLFSHAPSIRWQNKRRHGASPYIPPQSVRIRIRPPPSPTKPIHRSHLLPFNCFPLVIREVVREIPEVGFGGTFVVCSSVGVHDVHPALRVI